MSLALQPAMRSDIETIRSLAFSIWNRHYPPIIGQEQVDYMLSKNYSEEQIAADIASGAQHYYLLNFQGNSVGFCAVSETEAGNGFLNKLYVSEEVQGKGIGAQAIQGIRERYPSWNCLRLQVNRQNYTAINFYFKVGFVIERVADFDIGEGYQMNDFIMKLTFV